MSMCPLSHFQTSPRGGPVLFVFIIQYLVLLINTSFNQIKCAAGGMYVMSGKIWKQTLFFKLEIHVTAYCSGLHLWSWRAAFLPIHL